MKMKLATIGLLAAALIAAPIAPASANDFRHSHWGGGWDRGHGGGGGLIAGIIGAGAAVTVAAATLATAPFRVVADIAAPAPPYYGPPAYYGPPQPPAAVYAAPAGYYAPYGYYQQPRRVVYAYPQPVYGYPAPAYYPAGY